eukprot:CAMPEP_0195617982 /NCGR_PEP_ID=MMETSP0815-20121206/13848_1 /TAXON_ID=97485 /ORGANISM="Prymnesium parvum, Strain Texoma1" /LENGTH=87 /DNA_ID=CAMNT_0040758505 /DNA_START=18 /DNA_END=281 /DNA_ORIENTATION=+
MAAARASLAIATVGVGSYFLFFRSSAVEANDKPKPGLVRRHSSGDHAFLPSRTEIEAKKAAARNFGVAKDQVQDSEEEIAIGRIALR